MAKIPAEFLDLFEKKAFGHLATIMKDGSPQVTPLWVDYDGKYVLINSARGRVKDKNMRRDARVAIEVQDPQNSYRYILIRGVVVEDTELGAVEHIEKLSMKYTGQPFSGHQPGIARVIYKIAPRKVTTSRS